MSDGHSEKRAALLAAIEEVKVDLIAMEDGLRDALPTEGHTKVVMYSIELAKLLAENKEDAIVPMLIAMAICLRSGLDVLTDALEKALAKRRESEENPSSVH